ncbi:MAG: hypothetical protein JW751_15220 [Polyangiaceae bacterium]|nr:hypothetical protein [Polyangiaceae bacterium]
MRSGEVGASEASRRGWIDLWLERAFPGHEKDDVFVRTDPKMSARDIIETYSYRWSLEVTFHETKGKLGLEDPQNRTEHAVERTAPMALSACSLVVLRYARVGRCPTPLRWPRKPPHSSLEVAAVGAADARLSRLGG